RLIKLEQAILKGRELEVIVFLTDQLGGPLALRTEPAGQRLIDVHFVENAILPFVVSLVDVPIALGLKQKAMHGALVARLGGADKAIDAQVQLLPQGSILPRAA